MIAQAFSRHKPANNSRIGSGASICAATKWQSVGLKSKVGSRWGKAQETLRGGASSGVIGGVCSADRCDEFVRSFDTRAAVAAASMRAAWVRGGSDGVPPGREDAQTHTQT